MKQIVEEAAREARMASAEILRCESFVNHGKVKVEKESNHEENINNGL